jgi:hypothetical protein
MRIRDLKLKVRRNRIVMTPENLVQPLRRRRNASRGKAESQPVSRVLS